MQTDCLLSALYSVSSCSRAHVFFNMSGPVSQGFGCCLHELHESKSTLLTLIRMIDFCVRGVVLYIQGFKAQDQDPFFKSFLEQ